ncbi:cell division protein FtsQ [[Haemophilus] ducreyi]|uniref:SufI protein n=2 Tax=Haemophilus ducreyi TaxID=730 RepID=Q7VPL4_HAEDU|nr:multicopper oxidase domain-containing protein [[Haemophilus] ducreyi]AAP95065.1 SufI protein [[Haemophilus] ducreyi 35000HP]AKO30248.1 cell division protein FtsQ [[Haemophilus] ducreyi]AKO31682.1 cell division protein FtsQ [[Haemophilus] ducreyi]AKO33133.1 cell division protein FtsQ [[Haemophilus] ducreyi]AKO34583.1 cell division protein FtsQ [[Haemophilus] ducreyi]
MRDSKLTRRQLLNRAMLAGGLVVMPKRLFAAERKPLTIPPLLEIGRGRPIRLDLRPAQTQFEAGKLVDVWGVNGQYLAPTVRVKRGDVVRLSYVNNLSQEVAMNIQGLLASTNMVGSPHHSLKAHSHWSPIILVNQPACTAWYHADTMLNSAHQLYRGLAGFWLIEDKQAQTADLPNKYGVNDIPLLLQDQLLNGVGVQLLDSNQKQFWGKRLFVNGQENVYHSVPRGWVRLRLVNASLSRSYQLRLDNDQPLLLIATGMGMLAKPVEMPQIQLAPSARVEVLVDLNQGNVVSLISGAKRDLLYQAKNLFNDNDELVDNVILELRPEGMATLFSKQPTLPAFDLDDFKLNITQERQFVLRPLDYLINQQRFDPKRIDFTIKQGTVERWYLTSNEAVGFTLQGAKFIVETRDQQKEPYKQLAWQDTVWLEAQQPVTLLVRFEHLASAELPFTFGVSDFMLRDRGAMGQFSVVP